MDCPYDVLARPLAQSLFSRFASAKLEAFQAEYPNGVLPLGVHDFIATLVMIGEGSDEDFTPWAVFKSVSLERCERFRVPFELLTLMEGEHRKPHREAAHSLIHDARGRGGDVVYVSSWSMRPGARQDSRLKHAVRNLMRTALCFHHLESGFSEVTAVAVPRLRTDDFLRNAGFKELQLDDQPLPSFSCDFSFGETVVAFHASSFRADFIQRANSFKHVWDARRVISANPLPRPPQAREAGLETAALR
ncbi:hypothetical protein [Archangium sp.]|uniref:hypothetical protein n=1 Tax=Archangium sp. TaxID=1872627 RepID=UPI003899EBFC